MMEDLLWVYIQNTLLRKCIEKNSFGTWFNTSLGAI